MYTGSCGTQYLHKKHIELPYPSQLRSEASRESPGCVLGPDAVERLHVQPQLTQLADESLLQPRRFVFPTDSLRLHRKTSPGH